MAAPAVVWFEVTGEDGPALQRFYGDLFDWEFADAGDGYGAVAAGPGGIAGGVGTARGGAGKLTFYVEVDDPQAYLDRALALGGTTVVPVTERPEFGLTFAAFADPDGHVVGLSKGVGGLPSEEA